MPDESVHEEDDNNEGGNTYDSVFTSFTENWLQTQLTHHVSLAGANAFWKLCFKYVKEMYELKEAENITRAIPQFVHVRRQVYKEICPEVKMTFVFMNKNDGTLHHVQEDETPLKNYQRDPQFRKLYEEAHIQVFLLTYYLGKYVFTRSRKLPYYHGKYVFTRRMKLPYYNGKYEITISSWEVRIY